MCVIHFSLRSTTQTLVLFNGSSLPVLMPDMLGLKEENPSFAGKSTEEGREVLREDRKVTEFRDDWTVFIHGIDAADVWCEEKRRRPRYRFGQSRGFDLKGAFKDCGLFYKLLSWSHDGSSRHLGDHFNKLF